MITVELDIAHDNSAATIAEWAARFNATTTLVTENGPVGGNPIYAFTGTPEDIKALERDYWGGILDDYIPSH